MVIKSFNVGCFTGITTLKLSEGIRWLDVELDEGSLKMTYLAPPNGFDKYIKVEIGVYKEGMSIPGNARFIARTKDLYVFQIG